MKSTLTLGTISHQTYIIGITPPSLLPFWKYPCQQTTGLGVFLQSVGRLEHHVLLIMCNCAAFTTPSAFHKI